MSVATRRVPVRAHARGFTLVEMMAVAAIIAIIAVLAVYGVRRWINSSHIAEATEMVQAIGGAQEQYRADRGTFANITAAGSLANSDLCPAYVPGAQGTWDSFNCPRGSTTSTSGTGTSTPVANTSWTALNIVASKQLWYSYGTWAGAANTDPNASPIPQVTMKGVTLNYSAMAGGVQPNPYYAVIARGDLDADGVYATVFYASFARTTLTDNESE